MSEYMSYPRAWKPDQEDFQDLMMIRLPEQMQEMSKDDYWMLMAQRIDWMIRRWMDLAEENQAQTHQRLCNALSQLNSIQAPPDLNPEWQTLTAWVQEWAATFIEYNDRLKQRIYTPFPVKIQPPLLPEAMEQWIMIHDTMNLAEWLEQLTYEINDW
jgi:hypothetical protein